MVGGVDLPCQVPGPHEGNGDRIPKNHLDGGGGDRGEVERAQFPLEGEEDAKIAALVEKATLRGGNGDKHCAAVAGEGGQAEELLGRARFAEQDEDVPGGEGADVAVESVEGGQEGGRDAEGDEGGGDLAGDEAGLANAGEEDGAGGGKECAGEGKDMGEVEVSEEVVDVFLLGMEEVGEGLLVNGFRRRGRQGSHSLIFFLSFFLPFFLLINDREEEMR